MDLLLPGLGTLVWNTLFFLLTVAVLTKLAWKPILSMLDARDKSIEEALSDAQKAKLEKQFANFREDLEKYLGKTF